MSSVSKALALPTQWLRKWPINSRQVFAAVAYQVRGPRELVKRPITVLVQMVRIGPALADAGIGTIEEEQPVHPVRLCLGEGAGDVGPDAVTDDLAPSQPEPVGKGLQIVHHDLQAVSFGCPKIGLVGIAETAQVEDDDVEVLG